MRIAGVGHSTDRFRDEFGVARFHHLRARDRRQYTNGERSA